MAFLFELRERKVGAGVYGVCSGGLGFNPSLARFPKRLTELEFTTERLELSHDTFSRNTRNQLRQVFETLRELAEKVTPPEPPPEPPKRPIGFVTHEDKPSKPASSKAKAIGKKT